jgi:hypothetical protein
MNRRIVMVVSLIIILALVLAYVIMTIPTSSISLYVDPRTVGGSVGQDFSVSVRVSNVVDLFGWQFKLKWNNTILDFLNATEDSFLKSGGDTEFIRKTNLTEGYVILYCSLLSSSTVHATSGVNGSGALATIGFHVREVGRCDLDLADTMLLDSAT